jgi:ankyrin repeat protein
MLQPPETRSLGFNKIINYVKSSDFENEELDPIRNNLLRAIVTIPDESSEYLIKMLVEKGVDINAKNKNGQTVIYDAIRTFHKTKNNDEKGKIFSNIKLLLDKGIDVNSQDNYGRTPFHIACMTTSAALLGLLLKKNPHVFIKDMKGNRGANFLRTDEMKKIYESYLKM